MRKYRTMLSVEKSTATIEFLYEILCERYVDFINERWQRALDASRQWAIETRNIGAMFYDQDYAHRVDEISIDCDVELWYRQSGAAKSLPAFLDPVRYRVFADVEMIEEVMENQRTLYGENVLFRAGKFLTNWSPDVLWRRCETVPATHSRITR